MIVVTGGAGFIGSGVVHKLNSLGETDILVVDRLGSSQKWQNLRGLKFADFLDKDDYRKFLERGDPLTARAVIHLGACSATTETDASYLFDNNFRYSQLLCAACLERGARLIVASSAATYGGGELGFDDDITALQSLRPLNAYAFSKHLFDLWAARQGHFSRIAALKFFNVFGPNEYHKGGMRSVAHQAFTQIRDTGAVKLFRSYRPDYPDGGQLRDFISLKDCLGVIIWLLERPGVCGLFNLGSGRARTFGDLARAVFSAMGKPERIEYIEMPPGLREKYQYFTEARMEKLREAGYDQEFTALEDAVADYVKGYLMAKSPYLADVREDGA